MAIQNLNITISKYRWANNTPLKDINFFSGVTPALVETIDVKDYLMSLDELNVNFDSSGDDKNKNFLFFETSDISLTLSGIVNNKKLVSFFGLFSDTKYNKWEFRISDLNNNLLYKGVVSQENIDEGFDPSPDSEQIKVQVFGFEKEFKEYYSQVELKSPNDFIWFHNNDINRDYLSLNYLLQRNFDSPLVHFQLGDDINEYNVIRDAVLTHTRGSESFTSNIGSYTAQVNDRIFWSTHGGEEDASATAKTDFIITKAELLSAGLRSGDRLKEMTLRFQTNHADRGTRFHDFNIKMALTSSATITGFYGGAMSNVHNSTFDIYVSGGTGTAEIDKTFILNQYFQWDGESNILVRYCYNYAETFHENSNVITVSTYTAPAQLTFNLIKSDIGALDGCALTTGDTQDLQKKPVIKLFYVRNVLFDRDVFIKSSYERFRANGENRYNWLQGLCGSMGWVFYFWKDKFYVTNRSSDISSEQIIDYRKFINWRIKKNAEENLFSHIVILDGTIFGTDESGGGDVRGARFNLISNLDSSPNQTWWDRLDGFDLHHQTSGYRFMTFWNEDDYEWRYMIRQITNPPSYGQTIFSMRKEDILFINAGDSGRQWWAYDGEDGRMFPWEEGASAEITGEEIRFKGNAGEMLFKGDTQGISQTYQDYVKTQLFRNNFLKFFAQSTATRIEVTYNELLLNPLVYFTISNSNEFDLSGEWNVNSITFDFNEDTTKLILQRRN